MTNEIVQGRKIQLQLDLPYKFEPLTDPRVKAYLDQGYRIVQLQRLTDREALVTLSHE